MNARRTAIVLLLALAEAALIAPIISAIFPLEQPNAAVLLLGGMRLRHVRNVAGA